MGMESKEYIDMARSDPDMLYGRVVGAACRARLSGQFKAAKHPSKVKIGLVFRVYRRWVKELRWSDPGIKCDEVSHRLKSRNCVGMHPRLVAVPRFRT